MFQNQADLPHAHCMAGGVRNREIDTGIQLIVLVIKAITRHWILNPRPSG
jgi:hypothetical protein